MYVKEIDAADLKARIDAGEEIALIDIRSDAHYAPTVRAACKKMSVQRPAQALAVCFGSS